MHCGAIFRLINAPAATYAPENPPRINRTDLLPFQWVFAHCSPFKSPLELFPYFCGSAARTAVIVIGRPFLPVHWGTNSNTCLNGLIRCINPVQMARFLSPALRPYLRSPGVTTLCKHNMYSQFTSSEWTCQSQVVSFMPSQLHCSVTDFPTLSSPKSNPSSKAGHPTETNFSTSSYSIWLVL
jgi:hypothetical protein